MHRGGIMPGTLEMLPKDDFRIFHLAGGHQFPSFGNRWRNRWRTCGLLRRRAGETLHHIAKQGRGVFVLGALGDQGTRALARFP
jgi:hypothetical protein